MTKRQKLLVRQRKRACRFPRHTDLHPTQWYTFDDIGIVLLGYDVVYGGQDAHRREAFKDRARGRKPHPTW